MSDIQPVGDAPRRRITVTRGSAIEPERLEWWEPGLVLRASINLLAAREDKGKSTVAASWAARETRQDGNVIWIGTEESRTHVQVPRLIANGANMDRVIFLDVETELGGSVLVFPLDLAAFESVIVEHGVTMIVLDPCKGLVPTGFSGNDDIAVRQYLEPLAALAARRNVIVVGLAHFGKRDGNDSGKLLLGSVAWSQVARTVLSIAENTDTGSRVLTNTKSNYTPDARSVEFSITGTTVASIGVEWGAVNWLGDTTLDARDLLGGTDDSDDAGERTAAEHWLEDYLNVNGPTPSKSIKAEAGKERISEATLKRAKKKLGIADRSSGFPRTSTWYLPSQLSTNPDALRREPTELTEPTGPDLHKQNEPTGPDSPVSSVGSPLHVPEPTGDPTGGLCSDCQRAPARTDTGRCDFCTTKHRHQQTEKAVQPRPATCIRCFVSLPTTATASVCDSCDGAPEPTATDHRPPPPAARVIHSEAIAKQEHAASFALPTKLRAKERTA